jgi:uncharacterized phage protein gp47/JayE
MSLGFSATGLTIQTYQEIYDELVAAYQAIYGTDINTDADSPDGQRIGIEAKLVADMQAFALQLYNQMDPVLSSGESLNRLIKLAGLYRQAAARSYVDATITTDRTLTLPAGYAVLDDLDQRWITTAEQSLAIGPNTVTLVSEDFGAVAADADTITSPADVVLGVVSVTNTLAATIGRDEETDPELRARRNRSLQAPATSTTGGLFSALGNLLGVTDLVVYENDTDVLDAERDIAAHTIWCVIEGGTTADIIETLAKNKTGGTGIKGSVTGTYLEVLYKPDGTPYHIAHDMAFDRPVDVPLYVTLTVEGPAGGVIFADEIKEAIAAHEFHIASSITAGNLYDPAYSVSDDYIVTLLQISDDDITYTDGILSPGYNGLFSLDVTNITITDITP